MTIPAPRVPFAPLEVYLAEVYRRRPYEFTRRGALDVMDDMALTVGFIAELAGVSRRAVHRWKIAGVPVWYADRIAVRAGGHPTAIWPDWYELEVAS